MKIRSLPTILAALALAAASAQAIEAENNLITNPKFETADSDGHPEGWHVSHPNYLKQCQTTVEMTAEGETPFYRVTKAAGSGPGLGWQEIQIPEGTTALRVAVKMRGQNIVRGAEGWAYPGVSVTYLFDGSDQGKPGSWDKWPVLPTGSSDWQDYEAIIPVAEGAKRASVGIISQGWTGTADFAEVVVEKVE